ncbi:MAG TPA: cytochrome b/b6 domain-containing protein [Acetobacteraceae bacterium]|nr:cytochrome b/b6 domain-containing protein [Acetobacteraceae bacterium]
MSALDEFAAAPTYGAGDGETGHEGWKHLAQNDIREQRFSMQVWDAPTRLFHWLIVGLVFTSWLCATEGWMDWHVRSGYCIFTLLLFRLAWGVIGSDTARFSRFLRSPAAALRHLAEFRRPEPDDQIGHNAAGGWMVLVMLALLCVQVATGLCANDQVATQGPFADLVGEDASDWLTHIHVLNFRAIELVVLLHVCAVLAYAVIKRHNLVGPMITGRKHLAATLYPPRLASPLLAAAILATAAGIVAFIAIWWAPI